MPFFLIEQKNSKVSLTVQHTEPKRILSYKEQQDE